MKRILSFILLSFLFLSVQGQIGRYPFYSVTTVVEYEILSGTAQGHETSYVTSHPVTMPTGVQIGELILVFICGNDSRTISINTGVSGNNWTIESNATSDATRGLVIWKFAEGSDALTLTSVEGTTKLAFISYRLSGVDTSNPLTATSATGASTNADPPSNTPEYGTYEYIWFAVAAIAEDTTPSAAPTDFTGLITEAGENGSLGVAYRLYETDAAYNPGVFTSDIRYWIAFTVIVNPVQ
jgi:hypothetical protein